MAEHTINSKIKIRKDTSDNWTSKNPILLDGELGFDSTILKFKVGNGTSAWNDLPYLNYAFKEDIPTLPTNYVTTNTSQTVSGSKTFDAYANLQKRTLEYVALDYLEFLHPYLYKNTFKSNWSDFTRNVGTEYVFQMNNEFKIIVGTANFTSTAKTVTFSEPFSEGCYVVGSSNARLSMSCYDFTKTGFTVRSDSSTSYNFYYIAIGK